MAMDASYQAIPEDCELLARARQDEEWAEALQFFHGIALRGTNDRMWMAQFPEFALAVVALVEKNAGLKDRYFFAGRAFDLILYLLSPERRERKYQEDQSLIRKAIYGVERLHPEALATQGRPIGFVPAREVAVISEYFAGISEEKLLEHYDPELMWQAYVYKMYPEDGEILLQRIREGFAGMQNIYQQAAAHGEAMITVID